MTKFLSSSADSLATALLRPINPAVAIFLGLYTIIWGLWIVSPFWDVFTVSTIYSKLASTAPELFWGSLAVFCGSITTWGAFKRTPKPLLIGAVVACWHWIMISIFYFLGDWQSTGGLTALMFGIYAAYLWLNIYVNTKNKDNQHWLIIYLRSDGK